MGGLRVFASSRQRHTQPHTLRLIASCAGTHIEMLALVLSYLQAHPAIIFLVLYVVFRLLKTPTPAGPPGGRVVAIHSQSEFSSALADETKTFTLVDFSATWCPPCRAIGPVCAYVVLPSITADSLLQNVTLTHLKSRLFLSASRLSNF